MKKYNMYFTSKVVWYKPYSNLQFLQDFIYYWKDLLIDFIIELLI